MPTEIKDTLTVIGANGGALGISLTQCNEILQLVSMLLAIGIYLTIKENFYATRSKMKAGKKKFGERLVYLPASIASVLELWAALTPGILRGSLTFIWGCFTYWMYLILNIFLFIAVILTKILLDVFSWAIRRKTTL